LYQATSLVEQAVTVFGDLQPFAGKAAIVISVGIF